MKKSNKINDMMQVAHAEEAHETAHPELQTDKKTDGKSDLETIRRGERLLDRLDREYADMFRVLNRKKKR